MPKEIRNSGTSNTASARTNYFRVLVLQWVRQNRPEVAEAAFEEARKRYPSKTTRRSKFSLPGRLASLK